MEIFCPYCEHEFESDDWLGDCPKCGAGWWKEETYSEDWSDSWYEIYWD